MAGRRERTGQFIAGCVCCTLVACGEGEPPIACDSAESTTARMEGISGDRARSDQELAMPRTTPCTVQGEIITYDVKSAPFSAKGDGESDDIAAIQAAVD